MPGTARPPAFSFLKMSRVYVGNLGDNASKREIEREFEYFGPLRDVWIARNPPGFAFVIFEDRRDAEDATRDLDGKWICGNRVRVEMARGPTRGGRAARLGLTEKCYECGRVGHYARECTRKPGSRDRGGGRRSRSPRSRSRSPRRKHRSKSRSRSRSKSPKSPRSPRRNTRAERKSHSRSRSPSHSKSRSRSRSRSRSPVKDSKREESPHDDDRDREEDRPNHEEENDK